MFFQMLANLTAPLSLGQIASLWSIRLAMLCLFGVLAVEIYTRQRARGAVAAAWLAGALLAVCHSLGALITFHNFSQSEAFESTAQQTQALIGVRVGVGLYVNYLFVGVWLFDAIFRLTKPVMYRQLPWKYTLWVYGFLGFIAINGAVVFKTGWIRGLGIVCLVCLIGLATRGYLSIGASSLPPTSPSSGTK
jgi:hypothetical protein